MIKKEKWLITLEFKDCLQSISAALSAGYSLENAFIEAAKELNESYGNKSHLSKRIEKIIHDISLNVAIESALASFSERLDIDEINVFTDIIGVVKRTGGDIINIVKKTSDKICSKIELKRELNTMVAAKRLECKFLETVPVGVVFYLRLTSPEMINNLYNSNQGKIIMTACLIGYFSACLLINRILDKLKG